MPWTHDIGPFYWHTLKYLSPPPWRDRASTNEVEEPYRRGSGVALRVGRRRVLVLGRWRDVERDEEDALLEALGATEIDVERDEDGDVVALGRKLKEWPGGTQTADAAADGGDGGGQAACSDADARTAGSG